MTSRVSFVAWPLQLRQACHEFRHFQADGDSSTDKTEVVLGAVRAVDLADDTASPTAAI